MSQSDKEIKLPLKGAEVKLAHPIMDSGEELTVLKMRRPKARDLMVMDGHEGNIARTVALIAQLSDRPDDVIFELEAVDFNKASDLVADFLG